MYWGIDGCNNGWIAINLQENGNYDYGVFASIEAFWQAKQNNMNKVLLDMPIGLPSKIERNVELEARKRTSPSSFFSVPCRQALVFAASKNFEDTDYKHACDINTEQLGKRFSKQTWAIMPKIYEVDQFLQKHPQAQPYFDESHPELLFWALNQQQAAQYSKKQGLGFLERLQILEKYQSNALDIIRTIYDKHRKDLVDDDIVDALVCAVAARLGNLQSIPEVPLLDEKGLLMQMVYPNLLT